MGLWGDQSKDATRPNYRRSNSHSYGAAAKALIQANKNAAAAADLTGSVDYGTFDFDLSASFEAPHTASYDAAATGTAAAPDSVTQSLYSPTHSLCSSTQSIIASEVGDSNECFRLEQMVVNHDLEENREHCHTHNRHCRALSSRVQQEMQSLSRAVSLIGSVHASRGGSLIGSVQKSRGGSLHVSRAASRAGSRYGSLANSMRSVYTTSMLNFDFDHFLMSERRSDYERSICCAFHLNKVSLPSQQRKLSISTK